MNKWVTRPNRSTAGIALVVAAAAFWGMSGIFVTVVLQNSGGTSVSLAFWRDTASFGIFFLFTLLTTPQSLKIERTDVPWLIGMGIFLGGFHIFYNQSVMVNGASVTTVMQAAMPGIVTVAAFYLWKEQLTRRKLLSLVMIFIGTAMASGVNLFALEQIDEAGIMVGAIVPVFYAGWSLCGKHLVLKYGALACLSIAFGIASLMLLPLQPFTPQPLPLNPTMGAAFFGLITISTFGAFSLYLLGLKQIQAGVASMIAMSEIIFAGSYAWFLLDERFSAVQGAGAFFVIVGVAWLSSHQGGTQKKSR